MDDEKLRVIVPRDVLVKQGISAITYLAGGVLLLVMTIGSRFRFMGIVLSLVALVIGVGALLSRDREDKKPGLVIAIAGILGMAMRFRVPLLQTIAGIVLGIGAFGLFAAGIWKGIRFLIGLKSRQ